MKNSDELLISGLLDEQVEDVNFAVNALFVLNKKGVMFTNFTGTGKTHLGYGIVKAFHHIDKTKNLILAPTQSICTKWVDLLLAGNLDAAVAVDTLCFPASDVVVTTYANFYANKDAFSRLFDLIVCDESHYLMKNAQGKNTECIKTLRAAAGHEKGFYTRLNGTESDKSEEQIKQDHAQAAETTKVVFLSASPFAYVKNVDYAEGFLFEYGPEPEYSGYNTPSARETFYINHFGYRMRGGKLCSPEAGVDEDYMQQNFNEYLKGEGVLSHRSLEVDVDYSRDFIRVDSGIGKQIDAGIASLRNSKYTTLASSHSGVYSSHARAQLLEAIKAEFAVERIRKHMALGRKVVIFHSYLKDELQHPFKFDKKPNKLENVNYNNAVDGFNNEHPELVNMDLGRLKSAVSILLEEFPEAALFNGKVPKTKRGKNLEKFNKTGSGCDLIIVQERAGREGVDLHDIQGDAQRALLNLSLASDPLACIQIEGRTLRFGAKSDSVYEYFNTETSFEINTYATAIASRSRVAENLAVGTKARNLQNVFLNGYLYSSDIEPSLEQGKGGKIEESFTTKTDDWSLAKGLYYATQKRTSHTKSKEGLDFFATPEPLGLFMACLAKPKSNKMFLEPSAGNGSIAMWAPASTNLYCVEPSSKLMAELKLRVGREIRDINSTFEDYTYGPRFHSIAMNPPFGKNSRLAGEHMAHAMDKLAEMGTMVALVPDGPSMDKRIEAMAEDMERKLVCIHSIIKLPTCVFNRAGTMVKTKLVILKRHVKNTWFKRQPTKTITDFERIDNINELFEDLQTYVEDNGLMIKSGKADIEDKGPFTIDLDALPFVVTNTGDAIPTEEQPKGRVVEVDFTPKVIPPAIQIESQMSLFA